MGYCGRANRCGNCQNCAEYYTGFDLSQETEVKPKMPKNACPRLIGKVIVLSPRDRAWIMEGDRHKERKEETAHDYRVIIVDTDSVPTDLARFVIECKTGENALYEPIWQKIELPAPIAMALLYRALHLEFQENYK